MCTTDEDENEALILKMSRDKDLDAIYDIVDDDMGCHGIRNVNNY